MRGPVSLFYESSESSTDWPQPLWCESGVCPHALYSVCPASPSLPRFPSVMPWGWRSHSACGRRPPGSPSVAASAVRSLPSSGTPTFGHETVMKVKLNIVYVILYALHTAVKGFSGVIFILLHLSPNAFCAFPLKMKAYRKCLGAYWMCFVHIVT